MKNLPKFFRNMFKNKDNENGIAILLSLGFLSLMAILAVTFVSTTLLNNKAAKNNNDLSKARILVKSTVNRTIAAVKNSDGENWRDLKSIYNGDYVGNADINTVKTEDLNKLLLTQVNGIDYYTDTAFNEINPEWHYIAFNDGINTKIMGRIAFSVSDSLSKNGSIVISAAVDSGENVDFYNNTHQGTPMKGITEYGSPSSDNSAIEDAPTTGANADGTYTIGRKGVDVNEVYLSVFDFLTNTDLKKVSSVTAIPAGMMPLGGWGNSDNFFNILNINSDSEKVTYLNYFSFNDIEDPEAFWVDNDNNGIKIYSELYHRFYLNRSDWNSLSFGDIAKNPVKYNYKTEDNSGGIQWLKNWKSKGDMLAVEACKKQIIANLLDYCDNDNKPTTDYRDVNSNSIEDVADNDDLYPYYVGNDKCVYLNEVKLQFEIITNKPATGNGTVSINPAYVWFEAINLYNNTNTTVTPTLYIELEIEYTDGLTFVYKNTWIYNAFDSPILEKSIAGKQYGDQSGLLEDEFGVPFTKSIAVGTNPGIKKLTIKDLRVKLETDNHLADYAYLILNEDIIKEQGDYIDIDFGLDSSVIDTLSATDTENIIENIAESTNGSLSTYYHINFEAKDPRQNMWPEDWKRTELIESGSTNPDAIGTYENSNSTFNPNNAGTDPEPAAANSGNAWDISTAYIRNAPMKSPWELGAIHRGAKFQTINLKKYNAAEGMSGGGNSYADGDANILDQIKMTSATTTLGKINLNTTVQLILTAVFYGIDTNGGYETGYNFNSKLHKNDSNFEPKPVLTIVTKSKADELADKVLTKSNVKLFDTRAEVVNSTTKFSDNTLDPSYLKQTSDAAQEEIIGKFINITKSEDYINNATELIVIAVAQTIEDVGAGITIKKDLNYDGVIGAGETISNTQYGKYDQYADGITATQKLLIILYRSPDFKYSVRHFQYIND